jgi:hypothetical protein
MQAIKCTTKTTDTITVTNFPTALLIPRLASKLFNDELNFKSRNNLTTLIKR